MTTRKPKLNLLYATDIPAPWLQLAVVTPEPKLSSQQHAAHWGHAARFQDHSSRDSKGPRKH